MLLVLGQSLFVPQALQGGVGKGVWVWGKVDNFTKKKRKIRNLFYVIRIETSVKSEKTNRVNGQDV